MKTFNKYVKLLSDELESLNHSWIPSDEIEKIYSSRLATALNQYTIAEKQQCAFDFFPIISTILEEIEKINYKGDVNCCKSIILVKISPLQNIFEAFKFFGIHFSKFFHHPEQETLLSLYTLLLENRAFSESMTNLLLKKNAVSLFKKIVEFLYKINSISSINHFVNYKNLQELELISKIFDVYEQFDLLTYTDKSILAKIILHPHLEDLYVSTQKALNNSFQISKDLLLLPFSIQPQKLIIALHFLEKFKLREQKIDMAIISKKEPQQFAELLYFLSKHELVNKVFFEKLSDSDIKHLYLNYFQNPRLSLEEKQKRIFQYFSYFQILKEDFNSSILLLIQVIEIKTKYSHHLSNDGILDSFAMSIKRKLSLDITDYQIIDIIHCLNRLIQKDYDFCDKFSEVTIKELLIIICIYYNTNPSHQFTFLKYFKKTLYQIQCGSQENSCLNIQDTFIALCEFVQTIHQSFFKKPENNSFVLFTTLVYCVESDLKNYFSTLLGAMSKKECLEVLFILLESGTPDQIWTIMEAHICEKLSICFPNQPALKLITKLGQRALPPIKDLNEMFDNHFGELEQKNSFFNPKHEQEEKKMESPPNPSKS